MKKLTFLLAPFMALSMLVSSCSKDDDDNTNNNNNNNNNTTPATPTAPTPAFPSNVDGGALIAIRTSVKSEQAGVAYEVNTDIATAFFGNLTSSAYVDAGKVTVNDVQLDDTSGNHIYMKMATPLSTPTTLYDKTAIMWTVEGKNGVPAISKSVTTGMPDYTGTLPATITKSSGLSLTIVSGNTENADSVYVLIASGSVSVLRAYEPNKGTINISPADLDKLPVAANNTAILEVVPFNITTATFSGKTYAFINERAVVKNVTIN